jgi:hypothetical protein
MVHFLGRTSGTHTIILTTPVSVNESTVYTFAFDNAGLFFSEPNNYSGGRLLYGSTFYSGFELYFQVAVNEDAPLPVTLSSFSAVFSNGSSLLYWTTQSENNNLGWNVYRSETDNIAEGFQINEDTIEGAGTTTAQTDYSFADQNEIFLGTSYWYWIENVDNGGTTVLHGPIQIDIPDSEDNELPPELINSYGLAQNYPNPFNPTTTIAFKLTSGNADNAVINIYNPKGQIVKTFENLTLNDTEFGSVTWDGKDNFGNEVSSGIYMYKLKTPNYEYSKKMIMVK